MISQLLSMFLTDIPSSLMDDFSESVEQISHDLVLFKTEAIGGGAFGTVFRGQLDTKLCALKILHALSTEIQLSLPVSGQAKPDTVNRFRQECEYLQSFKHCNVVRHLATRTHPRTGHLILVLECMDCNLKQFFSDLTRKSLQCLPLSTQRSLCHDITSALEYIHSCFVVHRDLCSENILLDLKGEIPVAKICDFGMSRIIKKDETSISLPTFGHRGYIAPEAMDIDSTRYDSSFDIFSFGVIMIQIVQGLPTIKTERERKKQFDKIDASHPFKLVIEQCLQKEPRERPSASELKRELTEFGN